MVVGGVGEQGTIMLRMADHTEDEAGVLEMGIETEIGARIGIDGGTIGAEVGVEIEPAGTRGDATIGSQPERDVLLSVVVYGENTLGSNLQRCD